MIVFTVHSCNGQPVSGLAASFDELGGSIGRADTNQLVLPDTDRAISRLHLQVVFRNGAFAVIDRGSNPVLVNGTPLGNGREAPVRDGDEITIGGYRLRVSIGHPTAARDPFADLFADGGGATTSRAGASPPPVDRFDAAATTRRASPAATPAAMPAAMPAAISPPAAGAIPADWDPFGDTPPRAGQPPTAIGADRPLVDALPLAGPPGSDSLDALFGLAGSAGAAAPVPGHLPDDPFAATPLAAPLAAPNTAGDADPMRALGRPAAAVAPPLPDHLSDLHSPWQTPALRAPDAPPPPPSPPPARTVPPVAAAPAMPASSSPPGAVLSWDQPSRGHKLVTLPGNHLASAAPAAADQLAAETPASIDLPLDPALDDLTRRSAAPSVQPPAPTTGAPHVAPAGAVDALQAALAEGLGIPAQRLRPLDAAQLRLVGELLREATHGSVELLLARAALKREMRAQLTMIVARENNPLKFSPTVEGALQLLLGPPTPGFMPPAAAMRDAFDDLRAHQLGVMAGMRSALDGVLQRFDPAVLEKKINTRQSMLASLLPGSRKAQLWEQFQQLYVQLSAEAVDDFHQLFGKAFAQAYEAHIAELQQSGD